MKIEVFADGSGNTFNSDGGYGWRLLVDGAVHSEGSGYLHSATNNVAEITAAIEGLKAALTIVHGNSALQQANALEVVLTCDSQLVLGYANGSYKCKALHLTQLYVELRKLYKATGATTRWVRGHSGNEHNEACDKLAKAARLSKGIVEENDGLKKENI